MSTPILSSVSCFVYVHPKTPRASACAAMHGSGIALRAGRVDGCCYMTRGFLSVIGDMQRMGIGFVTEAF